MIHFNGKQFKWSKNLIKIEIVIKVSSSIITRISTFKYYVSFNNILDQTLVTKGTSIYTVRSELYYISFAPTVLLLRSDLSRNDL